MKQLLGICAAAAACITISATATAAQQWMTTSDGCTYSLTQAPGYDAQWVLVRNPTHLGLPAGGSHCPNML